MDFSFIYGLVEDLYKAYGRESIDPVVLVKIVFIQYIFGIPSMRKTIEEIEVNFAYRWFLGYASTKQSHTARMVIEDGKVPVMPYTRPMTKDGLKKERVCI